MGASTELPSNHANFTHQLNQQDPYFSPQQLRMLDMGYYAETFDRQGAVGSGILTGGSVYYMPITLFANKPVTSLKTSVTTAGSGLTLTRLGICDLAAINLAVSADVSASFQTAGDKETAISFVPSRTGTYFLQMISVGTTPPTMSRSTSSLFAGVLTGALLGGSGRQAGQADIPTTGTITYSSQALTIWVGVN